MEGAADQLQQERAASKLRQAARQKQGAALAATVPEPRPAAQPGEAEGVRASPGFWGGSMRRPRAYRSCGRGYAAPYSSRTVRVRSSRRTAARRESRSRGAQWNGEAPAVEELSEA